jgi:hypothetical protein
MNKNGIEKEIENQTVTLIGNAAKPNEIGSNIDPT